jgi:hypothetical protein
VLISEQIPVTLIPEANQDTDVLRYACVFIYNYEQVSVFAFNYLQLKLRIWDQFTALAPLATQLTVKVTSKDPLFQMPSISNIQLRVNIPPYGCKVEVRPPQGVAIIDTFRFITTNCTDSQLPLIYQYSIYLSEEHRNNDLLMGVNVNKITLNDPSPIYDFMTVLPSPRTPDGQESDKIVVIVSVLNQLGGVANLTVLVPV